MTTCVIKNKDFDFMLVFYSDLANKLNRIAEKSCFNDKFKKISLNVIVGYIMDIMQQYACLIVNPITVYSYGFLFKCTRVGQASELTTALT